MLSTLIRSLRVLSLRSYAGPDPDVSTSSPLNQPIVTATSTTVRYSDLPDEIFFGIVPFMDNPWQQMPLLTRPLKSFLSNDLYLGGRLAEKFGVPEFANMNLKSKDMVIILNSTLRSSSETLPADFLRILQFVHDRTLYDEEMFKFVTAMLSHLTKQFKSPQDLLLYFFKPSRTVRYSSCNVFEDLYCFLRRRDSRQDVLELEFDKIFRAIQTCDPDVLRALYQNNLPVYMFHRALKDLDYSRCEMFRHFTINIGYEGDNLDEQSAIMKGLVRLFRLPVIPEDKHQRAASFPPMPPRCFVNEQEHWAMNPLSDILTRGTLWQLKRHLFFSLKWRNPYYRSRALHFVFDNFSQKLPELLLIMHRATPRPFLFGSHLEVETWLSSEGIYPGHLFKIAELDELHDCYLLKNFSIKLTDYFYMTIIRSGKLFERFLKNRRFFDKYVRPSKLTAEILFYCRNAVDFERAFEALWTGQACEIFLEILEVSLPERIHSLMPMLSAWKRFDLENYQKKCPIEWQIAQEDFKKAVYYYYEK